MKKSKKYLQIFLAILLEIVICRENFTITREQVVENTIPYFTLNWTVVTPNPYYPPFDVSGAQITGEAFSFGRNDDIPTFLYRINTLKKPPRNGAGTSPDTPGPGGEYAGIECSAFVTRCLELPCTDYEWYNTWDLEYISLEIPIKELKKRTKT